MSKKIPPRLPVQARYITANPGGFRDDYSDFPGAAADEASEAPSKDEQDQITKKANERWAVLRAEENQRKKVRSLAAELREVGALAMRADLDLPELQRIEAELESARKRLKEAA